MPEDCLGGNHLQDLQLPSEMELGMTLLWRLLQRLSRAAGNDFSLEVCEAVRSELYGSGPEAGLAFSAAAWIVKEVVVDACRLGSCMAPAK